MRIISPSLLAANFSNISEDIKSVEKAGVNRLHLDVMDGHFVPTITFGPFIIESIRKITNCHLETHLMINNTNEMLDQYIEAGSDTIIIHLESSINPVDELKYIRKKDKIAGIALNPNTSEELIRPLLDYIDYILIMSVHPGKGGQSFISDTLNKMNNIVEMTKDLNITIAVDGGVNVNTINQIYSTGIDIVIVGSGLFNATNINKRYNNLLNA
tara:strand:+ start:577 stop:1218 length:642 start_codon:yes stop_codon:yes gene_type:complete